MTNTNPKTEKEIGVPRPPVVAVLGHVDHGKSTLLDYIRKTNVAEKEAGGITQRLGAYEVVYTPKDAERTQKNVEKLPSQSASIPHSSAPPEGREITFLDTPGHEAFKGIRARGASAADIAVLVVSGEDGVKPQTVEALRYIETAKIPYIVAVTKIDKPTANVERTKQSLAEHEIFVEGYGGDIPFVAVSSKTGEGVQELLELIALVAELHPAAAQVERPASGFVIESNREQRGGISATLLIKDGALRKGSHIVAEETAAPVRFIVTARGERVAEARAGHAVCVSGWGAIPRVGAEFISVPSRKEAEAQAALFYEKARRGSALQKTEAGAPSQKVMIPVIVKADSGGSLEAVLHELGKLQTERVELAIVATGVGALSESDLKTAASCRAPLIIGFTVDIDASARGAFERSCIPVAVFDVIYKLTEWVAEKIKERTPKEKTTTVTATARIVKIFTTEKGRQIIGGKVLSGEVRPGDEFRILRREAEIGEGKVRELQRFKEKISSAPKDSEFGASVSANIEIMPNDRIETITTVEE